MPRTTALGQATRVAPEDADHDLLAVLDDPEHPATLLARTADGRDIELPASLVRMLRAAVHHLLRGNTVLTLPLETRLTPNQAAELLGISRPFLLDLIARGHLVAEALPESRHRVLRLADVLEFQAKRERRGHARRAIVEIVEDETPRDPWPRRPYEGGNAMGLVQPAY